MKPMPIVTMTIAKAGCPSTRRSARRSRPAPKAAMTAIAATTPSQNGRPSVATAVSATKPPSIIRSPWAKLTVSVAL